MERWIVVSSDLKSVGYDESTEILEVEFNSEGVYQYKGVPKEVHKALMAATSLGKYFNNSIKDKFAFTKVR